MIIFGASNAGRRLKKILEAKGLKIDYFCDNDIKKYGKVIDGIKVFNPSCLKNRPHIVIASMWVKDIAVQLEEMGITNWSSSDEWLLKDHFNLKLDFKKIKRFFNLLKDKPSREVLRRIVNYRLGLVCLVDSSPYPAYFHPEVSPEKEDVVIDGGAHTGDTAPAFANSAMKVFSFEPEEETYKKLARNVSSLNNVFPEKAALWNKDGYLSFKVVNCSGSSHVSFWGKKKVKAVALDTFVKEADLIKLDVEGSEERVLMGARRLLKLRPKLQVCIYHKPRDLWEIPLLIKKLNPDYEFYLGHHSQLTTETVLYAK
ncbi:MAG: FkbM family methyltransferase [Candidatus Aureabacteria bacterium]|nr:FkbM family methyltransferase [Candidatus Auribacterota bacterium]